MKLTINRRIVAVTTIGALLGGVYLGGVAQAITDNAFNYTTPKTGHLNIPATAFGPLQLTPGFYFQNHILRQIQSSAQVACYAAPVHLPDGAVMKSIAVGYANMGGNAFVDLYRKGNNLQNLESLAERTLPETGSLAIVGPVTRTTSDPDATIDNRNNNYWVEYCVTQGENTILATVRVTYSYGNAGS